MKDSHLSLDPFYKIFLPNSIHESRIKSKLKFCKNNTQRQVYNLHVIFSWNLLNFFFILFPRINLCHSPWYSSAVPLFYMIDPQNIFKYCYVPIKSHVFSIRTDFIILLSKTGNKCVSHENIKTKPNVQDLEISKSQRHLIVRHIFSMFPLCEWQDQRLICWLCEWRKLYYFHLSILYENWNFSSFSLMFLF